MRPISVLIPRLANPEWGIGGGGRAAIRLANGISSGGLLTDLIVFGSENAFRSEISPKVHLIELNASDWLSAFFKLQRYVLQVRPLAIIAQDNRAAVLAIAIRELNDIPMCIIITVHSTLSRRWSEVSLLKKFFVRNFLRGFYLKADAVVGVSKAAAEDIVSLMRLPKDHVKVVYNPVVSEELFMKAKEEPRLPWFAPDDPPVILSVGRLRKAKDFATLIKAFALVRRKREVRLVIIGEGELRDELEKLVRELGIEHDVMMPGMVKNPYPYMARAAVFVLSSVYEGLPTVLIEALALGTPIVSTDCPSGPAEILENGKWGYLVRPGDPEMIAEAILQVLNRPRNSPPSEAWARFTIKSSVEKYLRIIEERANYRQCW